VVERVASCRKGSNRAWWEKRRNKINTNNFEKR
jgi:hypothetical protein